MASPVYRAHAGGQPGEVGDPTRLRPPGPIVVDDHPREVPPNLAPDAAGWRFGRTCLEAGERLNLADGTDRVLVDEVVVEK